MKEFPQQVESSAGFVFFEDLPRQFLGMLRRLPDHTDIDFKPDILPTDDFFEQQVSCVSPTHLFPWQLQRQLDIGYEYWEVISTAVHNESVL